MSYFQTGICFPLCSSHSGRLTDGSSTHTAIAAELGTFGYGDTDDMLLINNMKRFAVAAESRLMKCSFYCSVYMRAMDLCVHCFMGALVMHFCLFFFFLLQFMGKCKNVKENAQAL